MKTARAFAAGLTPGPGQPARVDRLGQLLAACCALHCLFVSAVIGVLPVVGLELVADRGVERMLVGLALAIGAVGLVPPLVRTHRHALPLVTFVCGAGLLVTAQMLAQHGTNWQRVLTLIGATTIAAAHTVNIRLCARRHGPAS